MRKAAYVIVSVVGVVILASWGLNEYSAYQWSRSTTEKIEKDIQSSEQGASSPLCGGEFINSSECELEQSSSRFEFAKIWRADLPISARAGIMNCWTNAQEQAGTNWQSAARCAFTYR